MNSRLLIIFLLVCQGVMARSFESYGPSTRNLGMSGAGAAFISGPSATWSNLAGLAAPVKPVRKIKVSGVKEVLAQTLSSIQKKPGENKKIRLTRPGRRPLKSMVEENRRGLRNQLQLGYHHTLTAVGIDFPSSNPTAQAEASRAQSGLNFGLLQLGMMFDLRNIISTWNNMPIVFGLIVNKSADDVLADITALSPRRFQYYHLGGPTKSFALKLGVGFQLIKDRLSLGIGPGVSQTVKARLALSNLNLDDSDPSHVNSAATVKNEGVAPSAGLMYRHPLSSDHDIHLGLSYRSARRVKADLAVDATLPLNIQQTFEALAFVAVAPQAATFALGYTFYQHHFALDIEWQNWAQVSSRIISGDKETEKSLQLSDIVIIRTAIEGPLAFGPLQAIMSESFTARIGYAFVPAHTPNQVGQTNVLDNNKHLLSTGLTYKFDRSHWLAANVVIDFAFQWQIWQRRKVTKKAGRTYLDGSPQVDYSYGGSTYLVSTSVGFLF